MPVDAAKEKELFASLFGDEDDSGEPPKLAPEAPKSVLDEDLALSDDALSESEILDEGSKAPVLEAVVVPSVEPPAKKKALKPQEKKKVVKEAAKKPLKQPKSTPRKQKEREQSEKVLSKISPKSKSIVKTLPRIPRVVVPSSVSPPPSAQADKASSASSTSSGIVSTLAQTKKVKDKYTQSPSVRQTSQSTQTEYQAQPNKAKLAVFHVHRFGTTLGFRHFYGVHDSRGFEPLQQYICRNTGIAVGQLASELRKPKRRQELDANLPFARVYSKITGTFETGCRLSKTPAKYALSPFGDGTLAQQIQQEYGDTINGELPLIIFGPLKLPMESLYSAH